MTLPEYPQLFGASIDREKHVALRETGAVLAELRASPSHNTRTENGVALFAHLADMAGARAWIQEASRIARGHRSEDATPADVRALWTAFGNFWTCLNVCPYGWARFRWRCEDLWGYPRALGERRNAGLADAVLDAREEAAEEAAHRRGIRWETVDYDAGDPSNALWWRGRSLCWTAPSGANCAPGLWRGAIVSMLRALNPAHQVTSFGAMDGTNLYFGRFLPSDVGQSVGEVRNGMPSAGAMLQRPSTGEGHRVWLWNDGTVLEMPPPEDGSRRPNGLILPVVVGAMNTWGVARQDAFLDDPSDPLSWNQINVLNVPVAPVIPPVAWYWDLLTAPVPGLRVDGEQEDLSLVEYAGRTGPADMIREVQRDVLARNLMLMSPPGRPRMNDGELFSTAERDSLARETAASAASIGDAAQMQRTVSTVATSATAAATAINPIAGVIVGAGAFVAVLMSKALAAQGASSWRYVDVFGRLAPAYEQFAMYGDRVNLQTAINRVGRPAAYPERTRVNPWDLAVQAPDLSWAMGAGAPRPETRIPATRTVLLRGLDPVRGARVLVDGRDVTTQRQENGVVASWQTSDDYGPLWVHGVPETAAALTVVYPDGTNREIALAPLPPDVEGELNIARCSLLVDATPTAQPNEVDVNNPQPAVDGASQGYPPRTVVLVGLVQGTRIFARGVDMTDVPMLSGDIAQWIDTTVAAGPATGWAFGVPIDDVRVLDLALPDGARRSIPLPPTTAQTVHDRVTVIDLRAGAAPPRADAYPARTLVLVGMPRDARVFVHDIDVTDTPMLSGDAARWIDSTLPGVQGWAFGVPNDTREAVIVTGAQRQPVPLPTMDPALGVQGRVTTIDVRWAFPAQASAGGGVGLLAALAALAAGGYYASKGVK